jgi:hypothetical protein
VGGRLPVHAVTRLSAWEREQHLIVAWRAERLIALGVKPPLALELAKTVEWDELADRLGIPR